MTWPSSQQSSTPSGDRRTAPAAGPIGVVRPRLLALVESGPQVVLVTAPPGSGKSTLLAHLYASVGEPGRACAFVRVDNSARQAGGLLHLLSAALRVTDVADEVSLRRALEAARPSYVLIDDVHELDRSPAADLLARLVEATPETRWVLAGRRPWVLPLTRLALEGHVAELGEEDLRFRLWEADELLRSIFGKPLSARTLAAAAAATDGWAVGLRLLALAMRKDPRLLDADELRARRANAPMLRNYLAEQVLGHQPAELRRFLMYTSVFDELTAARCDRLVGVAGSDAILERLASSGLFTVAEADGVTFRYHSVMRSFLRDRLAVEYGSAIAESVHLKASELLEEDGELSGALAVASRAGDWQRTRNLLARVDTDEWASWRDLSSLEHVLGTADPWAALASARRRLAEGALEAAWEEYLRARELFIAEHARLPAPDEFRLLTSWCRPPPGRQSNWVEAVRAVLGGEAAQDKWASDPIVAAVQSFVAGDIDGAEGWTQLVPSSGGSASSAVAAGLAEICRFLGGSSDIRSDPLRAEVAAAPVVRRLRDGLEVLGLDDEAGFEAVVDACELAGDRLGQSMLELVAGVWWAESGRGASHLVRGSAGFAAQGLVALSDLCDGVVAAIGAPRSSPAIRVPATVRALVNGVHARRSRLNEPGAGTYVVDSSSESLDALPDLELKLLGSFAIVAPGGPVELEGLRPVHRQLLWLLALGAGTWQHRDQLTAAVWPDASPERAARNLNVGLSAVRKALGVAGIEPALQRDGDRYRFSTGLRGSDLHRLERELRLVREATRAGDWIGAAERLERALDDYRELLPEAGPAEWIVGPRRDLLSALGDACERCVTGLLDVDARRAGEICRRAIEPMPFSDELWRIAIEAARRIGEPARASVLAADYGRVLAALDAR